MRIERERRDRVAATCHAVPMELVSRVAALSSRVTRGKRYESRMVEYDIQYYESRAMGRTAEDSQVDMAQMRGNETLKDEAMHMASDWHYFDAVDWKEYCAALFHDHRQLFNAGALFVGQLQHEKRPIPRPALYSVGHDSRPCAPLHSQSSARVLVRLRDRCCRLSQRPSAWVSRSERARWRWRGSCFGPSRRAVVSYRCKVT